MGRQYNKVENRKRRNSYLKRKKMAVKAKKPAASRRAKTGMTGRFEVIERAAHPGGLF
jgi:hypothetical protein